MVLTAAQVKEFFEDADQMAIPSAARILLQQEGIYTPRNLVDFDKDTFKKVANYLRRPCGRINNPDTSVATGATIMTPPFIFEAKLQMRLLSACNLP